MHDWDKQAETERARGFRVFASFRSAISKYVPSQPIIVEDRAIQPDAVCSSAALSFSLWPWLCALELVKPWRLNKFLPALRAFSDWQGAHNLTSHIMLQRLLKYHQETSDPQMIHGIQRYPKGILSARLDSAVAHVRGPAALAGSQGSSVGPGQGFPWCLDATVSLNEANGFVGKNHPKPVSSKYVLKMGKPETYVVDTRM